MLYVILGIVGFILLLVVVIYCSAIIAYWNEPEHMWTYQFGDSLGKRLYEWNVNVNKIYNNFWK